MLAFGITVLEVEGLQQMRCVHYTPIETWTPCSPFHESGFRVYGCSLFSGYRFLRFDVPLVQNLLGSVKCGVKPKPSPHIRFSRICNTILVKAPNVIMAPRLGIQRMYSGSSAGRTDSDRASMGIRVQGLGCRAARKTDLGTMAFRGSATVVPKVRASVEPSES